MEENEIKSISCNNVLAPFLRNQYFYGKLLTVRDFENEQSYFIKKQRLINKHIHGEGVVCGLTVEKVDKNQIKIKSGIALDCCGREIIVPDDEIINLKEKDNGVYWVAISYSECGKEQVAAAINANSCEENCCFSRIEEGYKIEILDDKPGECVSNNNELCPSWANFIDNTVIGKYVDLEKEAPKWVKKGEYFNVRLRVKAKFNNMSITIKPIEVSNEIFEIDESTFPSGTFEFKAGETKNFVYKVKANATDKFDLKEGKTSAVIENVIGGGEHEFPSLTLTATSDPDEEKSKAFVDLHQKDCPASVDIPVVLAKVEIINGDNGIEILAIDNAIIEGKTYTKNLVYSNPRLYELIKCVEKKVNQQEVQEQKDLPKIEGINWEHDKEYDPFNDDDKKELCKIFKKCTITFDKDMKKENINHKSLHVILSEYAFIDHPDYGYIEEALGKSFCPIGFDPKNEDKKTEVSFIILPFGMCGDIGNGGNLAVMHMLNTQMQIKSKIRTTVGKVEAKNAGMRFFIRLKGDFIQDENGNPLDANHIKGECPTGNGTPGGLFESWFDIKQDDSKINDVQKEINLKPGSSIEEVAAKINLSEETTHLVFDAMVNNNVIYSEEGKYYPLPDPRKIMVVYDTKTNYLKVEAEELSKELKEKGVSVTLKSVADFTDEDKENHEIILLRGNILDTNTSTKFSDISSKVKWDKSEGEIEIVHTTDRVSSPVFVIGGKNEVSVKTAVENYVKRYNIPQ